MVDQDIAAALAKTDLFGSLGKKPLNRLASAAKVVHHSAGKAIVDQGDAGVGFHVILSGHAHVEVAGEQRPDLGPGDYFGEISLIDGKPRSATVTAADDLVTASLTRWDARPVFAQEPDVTWALLEAMCARLRAAESAEH